MSPSTMARSTAGADPVARTAIVVARALLPARAAVDRDRVRLEPGGAVLTDAEAAAVLDVIPKPLQCRVEANDGVLDLRCGGLDVEEARTHAGTARLRRDLAPVGERGRAALARSGTNLVLVVGRDESIRLTLEGYERFQDEYVFDSPCLIAGGVPTTDAQRATGAGWVLEYVRMGS